jgi:hypothetical protein
MLEKRAFFSSLFCPIDGSIYCFGGNNGDDDIRECEKFSQIENIWRKISPLTTPRNGHSSMVFPESRTIFVFGGNN